MTLRVGICGLGAVGMPLARWLDGGVTGITLAAVSAANIERAKQRVAEFNEPPAVVPMEQLPELSDIVVECAPPEIFAELGEATLRAGKIFMPLSVTSLLPRMDLVELAKQNGTRIVVPTGAIVGLDAVRAASYGTIYSVVMKTRKPPKSLRDAKFVVEQGYDLDRLTEPMMLYSGTVAEAASMFPANVNIAVALAFAGIGPEKTLYEIWADPGVERNSHTVAVDADSTRFEISIAGVPTEETPGTGKLTPLSVMATLEGLVTPFRVGS